MYTQKYWQIPISDIFSSLQTSEKGLSQGQAKERLVQYGLNEIGKAKGRPTFLIFLSQFKNPLVLLLMGACILSAFLEDFTDAIIILFILVLNGILGFVQEFKSEKALEKLKKYISFKAKVSRNGQMIQVDSREVVVGDIVALESGELVPADLRLLKAEGLYIEEAALTGESYPVQKTFSEISSENPAISEMKNIAFMGTYVKGGTGLGITIATSKDTFIGRTAHLLKVIKKESDFQKGLSKFSSTLVKIILIGVILIFFVNALVIGNIIATFLFSVALAIGMIPEAMPMIVTIALSGGALRLAKKQVVVKRLASVEDFGNIDVVCTDKTGTITENKLTLELTLSVDGSQHENQRIMLYALLCNSVLQMKDVGNPVDMAIWNYAKQNFDIKILENFPVLREMPFDSTRKRMSVVVRANEKFLLITKGAPELLIDLSTHIWQNGERQLLTDKKAAGKFYEEYGDKGYRVIAIAFKEVEEKDLNKVEENGLTLLGFIMFLDPPKETAREALELSENLGVEIKILTGDGPYVTREIAHRVGLEVNEDEIIMGQQLDQLTDDALSKKLDKIRIIARATPENKYRFVKLLKQHGHVVGCLGDGVNDAPALKEADVGISVDQGSDIAKDAADVILLEKDLKVIVDGIAEGRRTFSNIVKYLIYTMAGNFGDLYTIGIASTALKFLPLSPTQVIMANFLTDAPTIAISTDNVEKETMVRPGRWNVNHIFKYGGLLGVVDSVFDIILILLLTFVFKVDNFVFSTALFLQIILTEILGFLVIRSDKFFLRSKPPSRKYIWAALFTVGTTFGLIYLPINLLFDFRAISLILVATIILLVIVFMFAMEFVKSVYLRKLLKPHSKK